MLLRIELEGELELLKERNGFLEELLKLKNREIKMLEAKLWPSSEGLGRPVNEGGKDV